jgi:hypothetical protein
MTYDIEKIPPEKVLADTFHDVLTASWERGKSSLTDKQLEWCEAFRALNNPTSADVARRLGVSRAASAKMKLRIREKLKPFYLRHLEAKEHDEAFEDVALKKQKRILKTPERLVKRRGQKKWLHLKAEKTRVQRVGLSLFSCYSVEEIKPEDVLNLKKLPKEFRTTHKASPLAEWWKEKAQEYASKENIKYSEALRKLKKYYSQKRPQKTSSTDRLCKFCRCLLPLGEIIPNSGMGKVTIRRKYCSNFCKTTSKRLR